MVSLLIVLLCVIAVLAVAAFLGGKLIDGKVENLHKKNEQLTNELYAERIKFGAEQAAFNKASELMNRAVIRAELAEKAKDSLEAALLATETKLKETTDLAKKELSARKSSEVRVGKVAENFAPFLSDFGYDPKKCHFIGQPIDFLVFDDDGVHFIEVKSGQSQLSTKQRRIRDQIVAGKVDFDVYRIK